MGIIKAVTGFDGNK